MEARATARYVRVAPRKARLVVALIRGKKIGQARTILGLAKKASAKLVKKVLESAVANAGQTGVIDVDALYVKQASVDGAASQRRFRPAPMGRAHRYRRRTSHITIVVDEA
ncbi:MAG: 50S ribosomal protein L22 [Deltaproteobacteria bacterium]|nr:50S ribosomal protein L22 [Deltaproteobacteria bacterium]